MTSPVEELRSAAVLLRQRAGAATPGPWVANEDGEIDHIHEDGFEGEVGWGYHRVSVGHGKTREFANAPYMAAMHPLVGIALADWLDRLALTLWAISGPDLPDHPDDDPPLRLARLILGGGA